VKLLLDVCVSSRSLTESLVAAGHDVISALAIDPQATDDLLLQHALRNDLVLVTEDKDFGELVFVQDHAHGSIVRLVELTVAEQVKGLDELLAQYANELSGRTIVTITRGRIRIRHRGNE
jgi:predicted nuclease of predicted toxin-antitoxin system